MDIGKIFKDLISKIRPTSAKKDSKKNAKTKKILKTVGAVFLCIALVCIITGCVVVTSLTVYVMKNIDREPEFELTDLDLNYATVMYVKDNATGEYVENTRIFSDENRTWVSIDDIPNHVQLAFVSVEDERFFKHQGVDWKRTAVAVMNEIFNFYSGRQGGSTITQQLIKNISFDNEISINRKIREIFRAMNLEKHYSKEEILESYLNTLSLGNNVAGIQSAAKYYFNKDVSELTIAEAAAIAAITSKPTYFDPYNNPENNLSQRNYVMKKMLEYKPGKDDPLQNITQEQYDEAIAQQIVFNPKTNISTATTSYFTDTVIEEVIDDLVAEKGYTYEYAESLILRGGLQIYTTMDTTVQSKLESKYLDNNTFSFSSKYTDLPQSSMVIMAPNGEIKGIVGGRGEKTGSRDLNRATQSKRQPGSSIKPLAVYMPMIDAGIINFSSLMLDSPITVDNNGKNAYPRNVDGKYRGNIPVDEAIQRSTNTVAMKLIQLFTPKKSFDFLTQKLGLDLVSSEKIDGKIYTDIMDAMSLGALTHGVSALEMAGAYLPIMNGGMYIEPHSYTKVLSATGTVLLEKTPDTQRVIKESTAMIMNKLMQNVVKGPFGTARNTAIGDMPVAGKTGTTDSYFDRWYVGLTPHYLGITWMGYDTQKYLDYNKFKSPAQVWTTVMKDVVGKLPVIDFPVAPDVVALEYCYETGMIASETCPNKMVGYYTEDNKPWVCTHSH